MEIKTVRPHMRLLFSINKKEKTVSDAEEGERKGGLRIYRRVNIIPVSRMKTTHNVETHSCIGFNC